MSKVPPGSRPRTVALSPSTSRSSSSASCSVGSRRRRTAADDSLGAVRRAAAGLLALVVLAGCGSSNPKPNPEAGTIADPLAYDATRQAEFEARATAGLTPVLVEKSPGGVLATARRVARFRPLIERAATGGPVDADTLEALVFLESAGRQYAQAGKLESAAGLTQILAQTATGLLGMHVDLVKAKKAKTGRALRRADDRFVPSKAVAGAVKYLEFARGQLGGRGDLAVAAYHMGVGNLQKALDLYGDRDVPYAELYFASTPLAHAAAWRHL